MAEKAIEVLKVYFNTCLSGMASCASSSTAHGVNHVANGKHPIIRFFWLLAFCSGTGIFLYHFYTLLDRFMSNPIAIVVDYRVVDFEFPDVTFCPVLPFSALAIVQKGLQDNLRRVTEVKSAEMEYLIENARLPLDNFILTCEFQEKPCNLSRDFRLVEDPRYKHCYTFSPPERKVLSTVPHQALRAVILAENVLSQNFNPFVRFKIPSQWQSSGVRVAIHAPNTHPHPESRGIDLAPGTSSLLGLSISRIVQIKDCADRQWVTICDVHRQEELITFAFAKEDCYNEVVQQQMQDECGCLSDEYELPEKFCRSNVTGMLENPTPICSSSKKLKDCQAELLTTINRDFVNMVISNCPYLCAETNWHPTLYSTKWPSQFAQKPVSQIVQEAHTRLLSENRTSYLKTYVDLAADTQKVIQNLLHVTIYPNTMSGNQERQVASYPIISLLGEVGGILGLWLGCSVLTFMEPIELLLHTITPCCMRNVDKLHQRTANLRTLIREQTTAFREAMEHGRNFAAVLAGQYRVPEAQQEADEKPPDVNVDVLPTEGINEKVITYAEDINGVDDVITEVSYTA